MSKAFFDKSLGLLSINLKGQVNKWLPLCEWSRTMRQKTKPNKELKNIYIKIEQKRIHEIHFIVNHYFHHMSSLDQKSIKNTLDVISSCYSIIIINIIISKYQLLVLPCWGWDVVLLSSVPILYYESKKFPPTIAVICYALTWSVKLPNKFVWGRDMTLMGKAETGWGAPLHSMITVPSAIYRQQPVHKTQQSDPHSAACFLSVITVGNLTSTVELQRNTSRFNCTLL